MSALIGGAPLDRVRSELFNAGNDWQIELSSAAVASFASTVERLYDEMPARLAESTSATAAVGSALSEARAASHEVGFSAALPVAERALARLVLSTLGGAENPIAATEQWLANRGATSSEAVARYLGEVLGQYARHVVDREAGRLAERSIGAATSAALSTELAAGARQLASAAYSPAAVGEQLSARWSQLVSAAFEAGAALPRRAQ
ncbi:MAG: hypothetical protein HY828_18825 [Actinobacteria bacterium]|nr:hypothetical protein [Actinomycetota bacterium]